MAIRGTKPTPTHLRLIRGDPRKEGKKALERKVARQATKVPPAIPEPPPHLMPAALEEWRRVAPQLHAAGTLTTLDRGALAAACQSWARWIEAEDILAALRRQDPIFRGLLIKTTNSNMIQNPLIGIANVAARDYLRAACELGMTPSSRSRVNSEPPDDDPEDFFT